MLRKHLCRVTAALLLDLKKKKKKKEMLPCRRVTILTYFQAVQMKELRQKTSDELTASAHKKQSVQEVSFSKCYSCKTQNLHCSRQETEWHGFSFRLTSVFLSTMAPLGIFRFLKWQFTPLLPPNIQEVHTLWVIQTLVTHWHALFIRREVGKYKSAHFHSRHCEHFVSLFLFRCM